MKRHGHKTDVVPFVMHGIFYAADDGVEGHEFVKMMVPNIWAELYGSREDHLRLSNRSYNPGVIRGWVFSHHEPFGHHEELIGTVWRKGPHSVFLINEDGYAVGGSVDMAVCSNVREDLKKFVEDFQDFLPAEIIVSENDIVHQWNMK